MNSVDIAKVKLKVNISEILNLVLSKQKFKIDIEANVYINKEVPSNKAIIYVSEDNSLSEEEPSLIIMKLFKSYKPQVNKDICTLTPLMCWQDVIELNKTRMLYFDHQSDGVDLFEDKELEEMGWYASALDITYRQIVEVIEDKTKGSLVFYDNSIQFSGFALVEEIKEVRSIIKEYICNTVNTKIKEDELDFDDEDVIEAIDFFEIKR